MSTFAGRYGPDNYVDTDGVPQPGLSVTVRLPGTATAATLYTDRTKSTGASNPVIADSLGNVSYWAESGFYDHFANGATIEDIFVPPDPAETTIPLFNVRAYPYLATGDFTTLDTAALQGALDDCRDAGGGIVMVPPGGYLVNLGTHPVDSDYHPGLVIGPNTHLWLAPGAEIGLADDQIYGTTASAVIMNYGLGGSDAGIVVSGGGTIDGNGANQGVVDSTDGIVLWDAVEPRIDGITVRNAKGTGASGDDETAQIGVRNCIGAVIANCLAERTAGTTSIGIVNQSSVGTRLINNIMRGMTDSHGYAENGSDDAYLAGNRSYSNAGQGFNYETGYGPVSLGNFAFSNDGSGYAYNDVQGFQQSDCVGSGHATGSGVFCLLGATGVINGGRYETNVDGINVYNVAVGSVAIMGRPIVSGNTTNYVAPGGNFDAPGNPGFQPSVPATTVAITNPYPFNAHVYITGGGAIDLCRVDGASLGPQDNWRVPAGATTAVQYSGSAPTWVWIVD